MIASFYIFIFLLNNLDLASSFHPSLSPQTSILPSTFTPQLFSQINPHKQLSPDNNHDNYYQGLLHGLIIGFLIGITLKYYFVPFKNVMGLLYAKLKKKKNMKPKQTIRSIIVGDAEVGKSCIVERYHNNNFNEQYIPSIGANFKIIDSCESLGILVWDTAGQQKYKMSSFAYIKGLKIFYVVYDCQNRASFESIPKILQELQTDYPQLPNCCVCIIANKSEVSQKQVEGSEGRKLAQEYGAKFFQVSAKSGQGIEEMFQSGISWSLKSLEKKQR